ncbi:hypothetical protein ACFYTQ_28060 [Nocardia sp. NPDC004068]|uniref:hypothetical protein n=1 Tax=Nocardia sp. NPDC004068 TaxID=3364303 RepID=UPI003688F9F0
MLANSPASATVVVPSTLWAIGPGPLDPGQRWPAPIMSRAVREFSAPGERVALLGWPAPTTRGGLRVAEPDTEAAQAAVRALGRHTAPGLEESADLVVVTLLGEDTEADAADRAVDAAVERMGAGAVLVVLARCRHTRGGVLLDPAGAVVAAAQAADLLYLQHIIAAPVTGDTIPAAPPADAPDPLPAPHVVVHTDVFVFLRPSA